MSRGARPRRLRVGLLGDRVPGYAKHEALAPALEKAAARALVDVEARWIPSPTLVTGSGGALAGLDGLVAAPQSPAYCQNPEGLMAALRFARQTDMCCLAVCGGAQYALREAVMSSRGEAAAASLLRVAACSPGGAEYAVEGEHPLQLVPGTRAAAAYGQPSVREPFACSYVVDDDARESLIAGGIRSAGVTEGIGTTLFEWENHRFYLAALFLPQWAREQPHPLFVALLEAASGRE